MRLTLKSVQTQAQASGYKVEKVSNGYVVAGKKFRLLAEVVDFLNRCLEVSVLPEFTLREVQWMAYQMGFMVQGESGNYSISYEGQVLGIARRLSEVAQALPEYKQAITTYYAKVAAEKAAQEAFKLEFQQDTATKIFCCANGLVEETETNWNVIRATNPLVNSVFDICEEYQEEDLGYELALCCLEMQDFQTRISFNERFDNLWNYLKNIKGELRKDLYEVMRPHIGSYIPHKFLQYKDCEIEFNPNTNEYSAFDGCGREGGFYLGGGKGSSGLKEAKQKIDEYIDWNGSFADAVNQCIDRQTGKIHVPMP